MRFYGLVLLPVLTFAQGVPEQAAAVLKSNCLACHGSAMKMSGLDLRSTDSILKGGERGAAAVAGKAGDSRLMKLVRGEENPAMPPGKKMTASEIEILEKWINEGAKLPDLTKGDDAKAALAKMEERPITAEERSWWAFVKPVRQAVPQTATGGWAKNPIDSFLIAKMESQGLKPMPEANRLILIRRAYLDLIGLPPTPTEVEQFVNDSSEKAWENLVERLLAMPQYGERWARHWLDLARYSDSGGYEYDRERTNSFRYRDWVISALNKDMPYDEFVKQQIAGDEFHPGNNDALIATGFLRLGTENNKQDEQTRLDELDDVIATTVNSFLGMTIQCARCHNHKFDPIAQKDYYRVQAVFWPMKAEEPAIVSKQELERWNAATEVIDNEQKPIKAELTKLEKKYRDMLKAEQVAKLPEYVKIAMNTPAEKRTDGQKLNAIQVEKTFNVEPEQLTAAMTPEDQNKQKELKGRIAEINKRRPAELATAMAVKEKDRKAPDSHFLHRGSSGSKGSVMKPGVLSAAYNGEWNFPESPADAKSSWRRKGFAEWVASTENPLTARVMVNRIWANHFGEGIVRTPSNFGKTGEKPSHPELLDWLAGEFTRQGWSIKTMHRLMMNSAAYRMEAMDSEENRKIDPENRSFWRMPRRRLEAEAVRDQIMMVAGTLDLTMGGQGVYPFIDPALFQSSSKRGWAGKPDNDPSTWRRSIYVFSKRTIPLPMLDVFDKPDSMTSCSRRNRSTIAPQALIMMNNAAIGMNAKYFAQRLQSLTPDASQQVKTAYQLALSRPPTAAEIHQATEFIRSSTYGLNDFCQALFNINEFVYIP